MRHAKAALFTPHSSLLEQTTREQLGTLDKSMGGSLSASKSLKKSGDSRPSTQDTLLTTGGGGHGGPPPMRLTVTESLLEALLNDVLADEVRSLLALVVQRYQC